MKLASRKNAISCASNYVTRTIQTNDKMFLLNFTETMHDTRRYVKIVKSDTDELDWHLRRQRLTRTSKGSDGFFCVRMYGLPFKVSNMR